MTNSQSDDLGTPTNKDANSTDAMECVDPESIRTKAERPQIGNIPVTAVGLAVIQVDQGNGQAHGRKAQDSAGLHAGQQQQGARARGPGQQGERAEAQGSREASSAGDQQRPKARHGPEARLGSKSREARRGS